MIHDPAIHKLGKKAAVHPKKMVMLAQLISGLPAPPPAVGWYKGISTSATHPGIPGVSNFPMDLNDSLGDCTIAGVSHLVQLWTTLTGKPVIPADAEVQAEYSRLCGYNPADPNSDQGGVESDILQAWQAGGIFGHKINGFVGVNPKSQVQVKDSIHYFGGAYIGVGLPNTAQDQEIWDVTPGPLTGDAEPGSWGGHCIILVAADARYCVCVTWGALKLLTYEWLSAYCDEAYCLLSPDFINTSGKTPGGVPLASLSADLKRITASA